MNKKHTDFEAYFDLNNVNFKNVNSEFERKFKERYQNSLKMMGEKKAPVTNSVGVNSLGILENMARNIDGYGRETEFEESYQEAYEDYEPYSEV